ncbi:hypothetical protein CHL78_006170 [Romboutsia weinsteinii]|uniref:Uncharacterized protein n=1 Tax=Romboutsia weinsteinii TaxID=2020949 RepID=A0A371J5Y2_9FIRM|nr:hypothetical protein [Romboutsia weinsteinii]RDY28172.1 hypothetical protein CHL78_006170 [Romboutsia weinsteinii]
MNKSDRLIINEYKNYFIRKTSTATIYMDIKTINDIKSYEYFAVSSLEDLEELSTEYKLYDSSYEEFRIAMGKFALGLSKSYKLGIDIKDKEKFIDTFLNLNSRFEELERKNIMKDAYVWK